MRGPLRAFLCAMAGLTLAVAVPASAQAQFGDRPYHLVAPIFTPKTGTSFTVLMTSGDDSSQSMLLRRYDAVGTLLTSQAVTIGAHGSLQASPAAHSGAPLHVELWANSPAIMARLTYTTPSDATEVITEERMRMVGPERTVPGNVVALQSTADATQGAVNNLQGTANAIQGTANSIQGTANTLQGTANSIQGTVFDVRTSVGSLTPKLDAIAGDVTALRGAPGPAPDARVATLQRDVTRLRSELRSLRRILLHRIPARRR